MGYYIDPPSMSKEEWLRKHATPTMGPSAITRTHVPLCHVDNGGFTACAIAFEPYEIERFTRPGDLRSMQWYTAPREAVREVSDLARIERHYKPELFPEA